MNLDAQFGWASHLVVFLAGSTALGIVSHMVSTFPTPKNVYGQWFLGTIKFIVGQRISALNAVQGMQSEVMAVTNDQKAALANGSSLMVVKHGDMAQVAEINKDSN